MSRIQNLVNGSRFNAAALAVIVANALLIGIETYVQHPALKALETVFLVCFVAEIVLRFLGRQSTRSFLTDGWNIFDIVIIAAALVPPSPELGPLVPILRILRVFRVLRLVKSVPELRLIVTVLAKSIVSMKYIALLAMILFYVFAIIGQQLFGRYQPEYATLHESLFTLFRILTGDDWATLRYIGQEKVHSARWFVTAFYILWISFGTFVLINLVVGAIVNNYDKVQEAEHRRLSPPMNASDARLAELLTELQAILEARRSHVKS